MPHSVSLLLNAYNLLHYVDAFIIFAYLWKIQAFLAQLD